MLFGSRQETVDKALASLRNENAEWVVEGACPDLTNAEAVASAINAFTEKYGRLDILVNNAGVSDTVPTDSLTAEHFDSVLKLNVNAIMYAVMPAVKTMKKQGSGVILNTSSMVSFCGQLRRVCDGDP